MGFFFAITEPSRHLMPANPAPFVRKTFDIVSDPTTDAIVCWGDSGSSFLVLEEHAFQKEVLPKYFKHDNLCSFIRQLNTYGFRKVSGSKDLNSSQTVLEFEQPEFRKDHPDLLANLKRKQKKKSACDVSEPPTPEPLTPVAFGETSAIELADVISDRSRMAAALSTLIKQQQETEKTLKFLWEELTEAKRVVMQLESKKRQRSEEASFVDSPSTKMVKSEASLGMSMKQGSNTQDWLSSDESDVASAARNMTQLSSHVSNFHSQTAPL